MAFILLDLETGFLSKTRFLALSRKVGRVKRSKVLQYLRQNQKIPLVGWVERSGTQQICRVPLRYTRPTSFRAKVLKTGFMKQRTSIKTRT